MRWTFTLLVTLAAGAGAIANDAGHAGTSSEAAPRAEDDTFHFVGEVKLSAPDGKSMGTQAILVRKVHDRQKSTIIERAIVVSPNGKVEDNTMRLAVKDDNTFTIADEAGTVDGSGTLFGPPWKWTYFKGTFKHKSGVVIEDENFMTDDSIITARKKVSGPDGKAIMYMEMSLKGITPRTFEILAAGLLK
jgi:hypothetical protein